MTLIQTGLTRRSDLIVAGIATLAIWTPGFGVFDNIGYAGIIVAGVSE